MLLVFCYQSSALLSAGTHRTVSAWSALEGSSFNTCQPFGN